MVGEFLNHKNFIGIFIHAPLLKGQQVFSASTSCELRSKSFDLKQCHLKPIRLNTWRRNIFITFNDDAAPLEEFLGEFEEDFGFLQIENCRLADRYVIDVAYNWKFVHENLMDFYHVGVLHARSFGSTVLWDTSNVKLKEAGGITIWYDGAPATPSGKTLVGKMPWLENRPESFASMGFRWPNLVMFGRIDSVKLMISWPVDVHRTLLTIYQLFPQAVFDQPDIEKKFKIYHDHTVNFIEEDRFMVESMQRAMGSVHYRPGRMSTAEKSLHHTMNAYLDRIFGQSNRQEAAE